MPSYLTLNEYKARTTISSSLVDSCASRGKNVQLWLDDDSSWLRGRLAKRYAVDFTDPGPRPGILLAWLVKLVDIKVWQCVGGNPEGRVDGLYEAEAKRAQEESKEAADSDKGLFELPLRDTDPLGGSAVNKGSPLAYAEASAYTWTDRQREAIEADCGNG